MTNSKPDNESQELRVSPLTDHEHDLAVFRVMEESKDRITKWLRSAAGILIVILVLFGLRAYTDYSSALDAIDGKISEQVRAEVAEYRKFTDQIISEVVEAKTRTNEFSNEMNDLETRMGDLRNQQVQFEKELTSLLIQARERYKKYDLTLVQLRIDPGSQTELANEQKEFIERSQQFAEAIGLSSPDLQIVFEILEQEEIQAMYDTERKIYIVNPRWLGKGEYLSEYVAIMGRFMLLHYERAFGDGLSTIGADPSFWNSFRYSLQRYIIEANTTATSSDAHVAYIPGDDRLYRFLKDLESRTSVTTCTKLATSLIVSFDPSWTMNKFPTILKELNENQAFVSDQQLNESLKAVWN